MDPELRTTAPTQATGAVELVCLEEISPDGTFRLRGPGDVSDLAAAIGRLGQLVPVELRPLPGAGDSGPQWQVVAGFRRIEALRLLQRDRVLARLHQRLPDDDAWALALSQALLTEPLSMEELEEMRRRLASAGTAAWAQELVDDAQARAPVPAELREPLQRLLGEQRAGAPAAGAGADADNQTGEDVSAGEPDEARAEEVEVTPEELAAQLLVRFATLNQDLALAFEVWGELPDQVRRQLLEQVHYVAQLFPFLERETP